MFQVTFHWFLGLQPLVVRWEAALEHLDSYPNLRSGIWVNYNERPEDPLLAREVRLVTNYLPRKFLLFLLQTLLLQLGTQTSLG